MIKCTLMVVLRMETTPRRCKSIQRAALPAVIHINIKNSLCFGFSIK